MRRSIFGKPFWLAIALIAAAFAVYYPYSPAAVQQREMDRAERFVAPLRAQFQKDGRFRDFDASVVTNITIHASCEVGNEADFNDLVQAFERARSQADEVCPIMISATLDKTANGGEHQGLSRRFDAKTRR